MAKRIKKKTYSEFLSWLEGVESMQEANWSPNAQQWKKVRDMLNHIKPEEIEVEVQAPAPVVARQPVAGFTPPAPGEAVGRMIDNGAPVAQGQPQSAFSQPAPAQPQPPPQRILPSGMGKNEADLLNPGEPHKDDEYL